MSAWLSSCISGGRSPTVLLVEDDFAVRWPLAEYLRSSGWRVIETSNAVEAMSLLSSPGEVDVLFVDFKLPGGPTGSMLAQWLETREPNLPVLLTSGLSATHASFARGKLRRFVPKPYDIAEIGRLLSDMLKP